MFLIFLLSTSSFLFRFRSKFSLLDSVIHNAINTKSIYREKTRAATAKKKVNEIQCEKSRWVRVKRERKCRLCEHHKTPLKSTFSYSSDTSFGITCMCFSGDVSYFFYCHFISLNFFSAPSIYLVIFVGICLSQRLHSLPKSIHRQTKYFRSRDSCWISEYEYSRFPCYHVLKLRIISLISSFNLFLFSCWTRLLSSSFPSFLGDGTMLFCVYPSPSLPIHHLRGCTNWNSISMPFKRYTPWRSWARQ